VVQNLIQAIIFDLDGTLLDRNTSLSVILISELEGIRKPDPAIFIKAADQLKVSPKYCAYVGDLQPMMS
jgi:FMN phosphatase YigB (HAD superfamily)